VTAQPDGLQESYLQAVLRGNAAEAAFVIDEGVRRGAKSFELMLEVLEPAQRRVGDLWEAGELNVAQEHLATEIALQQLERLRREALARPPLGRRVVACTVGDEQHTLGARMAADVLFADGWDVEFLGASVPSSDLGQLVAQRRPDVVVLSATVAQSLQQVEEAVRVLYALPARPKLVVGGQALRRGESRRWDPGPDLSTSDLRGLAQQVRRLVGLLEERRSLESFLKDMGGRVQAMRRAKGWSQLQLAERAGLDRTYISAAEHGKQNLTLGAVMKLSDALQVPIERLLTEKS
jgi:methanogenic corrinoid protein MtbC1/DNA-binding XRE family transcriptional regulator